MMNKSNAIFTAFLILMASMILFMVQTTQGMYDFKTDLRSDEIGAVTAVGVTSDNVVLGQAIYDDDVTTVSVLSDLATDSPAFIGATYSSSPPSGNVSGLTANATRTLTITYDVDALAGSTAISTLVDRISWIYLLMAIAFPAAALAAMFTGRK